MRRSADGRLRAVLTAGLPAVGLGALLVAMAPAPREAPRPAPGRPEAGHPAYPDLPSPAHTGGFGEPTCRACHFDGALNASGGRLHLEGWPDRPAPGATYALAVRLEREGLARAGFQLAVRTADGAQAGALAPADGRSAVTEAAGTAYLHHTLAGTEPTGAGEAVWHFTWTAPEAPAPLRVHAAANAADGDASPLGDAIYTDSLDLAR